MIRAKKNKAVFLDRDGVINREVGDYIKHENDFVINEGVIDAMKNFRKNNFLLIVITNQSGIAKGKYSHFKLEQIHNKLRTALEKENIFLDEIYYCPHHPSVSNCLCRKPDSLMLEKALARFNIDASLSYFIGDAERDMEAALKAGIKGIRVKPNERIDSIEIEK